MLPLKGFRLSPCVLLHFYIELFSHWLHSSCVLIPLLVSHFTFLCLAPSSCSLPLNFFLLLKLSSGSIGAFNRMYSLSKNTLAFSNRNLQLSIRLSTAREDSFLWIPTHILTFRLWFCYTSLPLSYNSVELPPLCTFVDVLSCHLVCASSRDSAAKAQYWSWSIDKSYGHGCEGYFNNVLGSGGLIAC